MAKKTKILSLLALITSTVVATSASAHDSHDIEKCKAIYVCEAQKERK